MAKYTIDKGFSFDGKTQRNKGKVVELSGDELKFAQNKKCVTKVESKKKEED